MLTASGSPLVAGMVAGNAMADQLVSVKVLRAFLLKAERQEVGKVLQLESRLAAELAGLNKVERLPPAAKPATKAATPAATKEKES